MIRKSPIKSPMQKLSDVTTKIATRGSRLVDSASTAVAQGAQLSNAVASRANATADEIAMQIRRSTPEKIKMTKKKKRASSRGGGGIRDRINKFDSASMGNVQEFHSTTPHRHRVGRTNGEGTSRRCSRGAEGGGGGGGWTREKENAPNREPSDRSLAGRDSIAYKNATPAFRQRRGGKREAEATYPINPRYREDEAEVAMRSKTQTRSCRNDETKTDRNRNRSRELRSDRRGKHQNDQRTTNIDDMDISDLNRAAAICNTIRSSKKDAPIATYGRRDAASRPERKMHQNATGVSSFGVAPASRKREKAEHPLIASPLRKHIRGVHDSAFGNATCTVRKDPFPLLPPLCARPLAAVANWEEEEAGRDGRSGGSNNGGGGGLGHLGTLGTVTGALKLASGIGERREGDGGDVAGVSGVDNAAPKKMDEKEAAFDLLTSAAFMFQHSRRNLG